MRFEGPVALVERRPFLVRRGGGGRRITDDVSTVRNARQRSLRIHNDIFYLKRIDGF